MINPYLYFDITIVLAMLDTAEAESLFDDKPVLFHDRIPLR
jgi:hypothetical protein